MILKLLGSSSHEENFATPTEVLSQGEKLILSTGNTQETAE